MKILQFQNYTVVIGINTMTFNKYPVSIDFLDTLISSAELSGRKSALIGCVFITLEEAKEISANYHEVNFNQ